MGKIGINFFFLLSMFYLLFKVPLSYAATCDAALVKSQVLVYSSWADLPKLELSVIKSLREYTPRYRGFKGNKIQTGLIKGQRVFIKTYPKFKNDREVLAKIISFNALVSQMGFGIEFLGVGVDTEGQPYTVNHFARGRFFRFNQMQWPYALKNKKPIKRLTRAIQKLFNDLSSQGVVVGDFQMFVHEDGSMSVVDTDEFAILSVSKAKEYNSKTLEKIIGHLKAL